MIYQNLATKLHIFFEKTFTLPPPLYIIGEIGNFCPFGLRRFPVWRGCTNDKRAKHSVQSEQGKSEDNRNLEEAIMPLVDSMNRTKRNLCVLRDALKIVSERQNENRKELQESIGSKLEALSAKGDKTTAEEIRALRQYIGDQISKPQHKKVTHDLTAKTWWLVGIGIVLFFCISQMATKIYDQSKEIEELQLAGWKYRALRATLPANNANVIWLEHIR